MLQIGTFLSWMIPMVCRWSALTQMESQVIHLTGIQQQKVLVLERLAEKIHNIFQPFTMVALVLPITYFHLIAMVSKMFFK